MEKALGWADYLESHARRAYSGVTGMNVASTRLLLNRIQKKEIVDGFTERELYRNDWAGLGAQQVGQALKTLEEFGHVMAKAKPGGSRGGRPSRVWHIHPKYAA